MYLTYHQVLQFIKLVQMGELQNQNEQQSVNCRYQSENNNDQSYEYLQLDNYRDDPLRQPEITVNLNQRSVIPMLQVMEEQEDDISNDYETDLPIQEGITDSEEQVVPSSQHNNTQKYLDDELTISDDDVDEGIFEDDLTSYDLMTEPNSTYDSQPP